MDFVVGSDKVQKKNGGEVHYAQNDCSKPRCLTVASISVAREDSHFLLFLELFRTGSA